MNSTLLEHPRSPTFMDAHFAYKLSLQPQALPSISSVSPWRLYHDFPTCMDAPFVYDTHSPTSKPYLQYPQSPHSTSTMACESFAVIRNPLCLLRQHLPVLTSTL
ncbi:hypothetical protein BU15DRAFT_73547 [Melanogaster broomeanus]|nr:hypothetical protein BU15DRAFT_73547 [Melanogaster broomeanus]